MAHEPGITVNMAHEARFVVVTGGSLSGLGKGTCVSSLAVGLKALGLNVTAVKIDPYLNIDSGLMSPFEHGECFVLADGTECDLDLGNYERFLGVDLPSHSIITTGKMFMEVLEKERSGGFLGKTVQLVPHVTDHFEEMLMRAAKTPIEGGVLPDILLVEVGGTIGDLESAVYIEALSRMAFTLGRERMSFCHLGYIPVLYGEQKTKPTQASIRQLKSMGIMPDFLFLRCHEAVTKDARTKISMAANISEQNTISVHDVRSIYEVAVNFEDALVPRKIATVFGLLGNAKPNDLMIKWRNLVTRSHALSDKYARKLLILVAGKYLGGTDAYISVVKAIEHAAISLCTPYELIWANTECTDKAGWNELDKQLCSADAILIPGGFGSRGVYGKVRCAKYGRENNIPTLGICFGLQAMVIEYARSVLEISNATSEEFDEDRCGDSDSQPAAHMVVVYMPETRYQKKMGGTMVLGDRATIIKQGTKAYDMVGGEKSVERHRHRYEVNPSIIEQIEARGELVFSGRDEIESERCHFLEHKEHPFYFGTQAHPELRSRPLKPSVFYTTWLKKADDIRVLRGLRSVSLEPLEA